MNGSTMNRFDLYWFAFNGSYVNGCHLNVSPLNDPVSVFTFVNLTHVNIYCVNCIPLSSEYHLKKLLLNLYFSKPCLVTGLSISRSAMKRSCRFALYSKWSWKQLFNQFLDPNMLSQTVSHNPIAEELFLYDCVICFPESIGTVFF